MPQTPTPIPSQIIDVGREIAISAFNQGPTGIWLLAALACVIVAFAIAIIAIRRPFKNPENDIQDNQITMQLAKHSDNLQKANEKNSEEYLELGKRSVAAQEAQVKALNTGNDIQTKYVGDIVEVKALLTKIDTVGSLPLQNVITSIGTLIQTNEAIKSKIDGYDSLFERSKALLEGAQETLNRIERRRATQELSKVVPPEKN